MSSCVQEGWFVLVIFTELSQQHCASDLEVSSIQRRATSCSNCL